jgi:hypothetical protein
MDSSRIAIVPRHLFLASGGHVDMPNDAPEARRRIDVIPNCEDLLRGPHIPMRLAPRPRRLVAFCCTCQMTVVDLPNHVLHGRHAIRYMLLPDLRA